MLSDWSHVSGNIWVSDLETTDPSLGALHDGSQSGSSGWPGGAWFSELDGSVTWGHQEKYIDAPGDFSELSEPYDWGWYGKHIYVYSTVDPGVVFSGMQVSQRQFAIAMPNNNPREHIVIDGLELLYTQSKGFFAGYPAREAYDLTVSGIVNARVSFNTFYGVNPTLANYQAQLYISGEVTAAVVRNNIFFNNVHPSYNSTFMCVKADVAHLPEIDMDYNLFFTTDLGAPIVAIVGISGAYTMAEWSSYTSETGWDSHSPPPEDPLFVDAPGGDLHLASGSPAVGAGEVVPGVTVDFDGNLRSVPPSLGAYAFLAAGTIFSDGFESGNTNAWSAAVP